MRFRLLLILSSLLLLSVNSRAEEDKYIFEHIQTSHHWINDIFQDSDGFIWVSCRNGLYRHYGDGPDDYETIQDGNVFYDITQDADGNIWVMSREGLVMYDPKTAVMHDPVATTDYLRAESWIDCFEVDGMNNFWWNEEDRIYVRTTEGRKIAVARCKAKVNDICIKNNVVYVLSDIGLIYRFVLEADELVRHLPLISLTDEPIDPDHVFHTFFVDSNHNIWVSQGSNGVWVVEYGGENITVLTSHPGDNSIQRGFVNSIIEDKDGNIWIASDHGGISICDKSCQVIVTLVNDPTDDNTLASNGIYSLYCDNDYNLWVGYTKLGLSVYRGENKAWTMSHVRSFHLKNLNDDINTTCEDNKGNLWLGTDGYGLVKIDSRTGKEVIYTRQNSSLGSNVITDIHCDPKGRIWVGTFYGGLTCFVNGVSRTWRYEESGSGLASDNVWAIDHDESGRIWIGTLSGGVQVIDPVTYRIKTFTSATSGLSNDAVLDIECADDGKIYVATAYGLSIIDSQTESVVVAPDDNMIQKSLTGVMVDSRGLVWLDEDGILQVYDPRTEVYHTPEYHALENIRSVIEGNEGIVWAVTDNGICRIEVYRSSETGYAFEVSSFSFPQEEDLHFNQRSASLASGGDMIIGSFCGFMRFRQSMFMHHRFNSDVNLHFTDLYIGNHKIEPGQEYEGRIISEYTIEYSDRIVLSHDMSIFSIAFSNLDYFSVHDMPLYYRMEGLSQEWLPTDSHAGRLTFTNLSPRKYMLTLTADVDDLSKAVYLNIIVMPPWWASWWAILSYILAVVVIASVISAIVRRRQREIRERLEQSIKQEKRHYVDEMKMQFFTNVSHDFRTPLTLILTPVEEMLAKDPEKKNDQFIMTIHRNAQRLLNLVNEVLDLRKIEMFGSHLNLASSDFLNVVRDTTESFRLLAEAQGIEFSFETEVRSLVFDFDSGKVVKILTNLLSNAFKFTPQGGSVKVEVNLVNEDTVLLAVSDSGRGVQDKDKRRVFDRFYQAKDSPVGSGIGLHVVREYVILHGGEIEVSDNDPAGSVFTVTLPVRHSVNEVEYASDSSDFPSRKTADSVDGCSTILVVDDNDDFRTFMCASLSDEYQVLSASDGAEALKIVKTKDVDVVISDVMMPLMDGNEFCRRMKSDINTSHIPVILLTAKMMQEDECHGLEAGADDYLTKPFNMSILRLRVAKFIEWKKRAKRIFEKELEITTEQITITTMDDRLLQKAINVINENIGNPDFSVAELSAALCMHRTSLYKKLVYITGKTPVEFIRSIRLKKAAALLANGGVYVSEIAYMVGFNSPKVFTGHFKDEFGCSPTEYRRLHHAGNAEEYCSE